MELQKTRNKKVERLFEVEPYIREHNTKVRETATIDGQNAVLLEEGIFFPGGGGQPPDEGLLGGTPVRGYADSEKGLYHLVDHEFQAGDQIFLRLDWNRRFDHMQQHTGQHIFSQAIRKVLGFDTVSFHLGPKSCTIDINARDLTEEELQMVEDEANGVIFSALPIQTVIIKPSEAKSYELRKLPPSTGDIRVVRIGDFDSAACCGTHLRSSGECGLIKALSLERIKGQIRIEFIAGKRALNHYQRVWKASREMIYSSSRSFEELPGFLNELILIKKENEALFRRERRDKAVAFGVKMAQEADNKGFLAALADCDPEDLNIVVASAREHFDGPILMGVLGDQNRVILDLKQPDTVLFAKINQLAGELGGKGGGRGQRLNLGGFEALDLKDFMEKAEAILEEKQSEEQGN